MATGVELRRYRKSKGFTLMELAQTVGVSASYLSEIEQGKKKPSVKITKRICSALGIVPGEVLPFKTDLDEQEISQGEKIRLARLRKGWNLTETGKKAGISPAYLSQIERGQVNPSIAVLKRLTQVLEVSLPVVANQTSPSELGQRIKKMRSSLGLTQQELAGQAGISISLVIQIEEGKSGPSLETLERIAIALDISPCSLILDPESDIETHLANIPADVRQMLIDPRNQVLLKAVSDFNEEEFRFLLNFIELYKQNQQSSPNE